LSKAFDSVNNQIFLSLKDAVRLAMILGVYMVQKLPFWEEAVCRNQWELK